MRLKDAVIFFSIIFTGLTAASVILKLLGHI